MGLLGWVQQLPAESACMTDGQQLCSGLVESCKHLGYASLNVTLQPTADMQASHTVDHHAHLRHA
jgi:hypothetical protein